MDTSFCLKLSFESVTEVGFPFIGIVITFKGLPQSRKSVAALTRSAGSSLIQKYNVQGKSEIRMTLYPDRGIYLFRIPGEGKVLCVNDGDEE